ncbi:aspartate/glutamate racemase family protein [Paenibacillus sp. GCM10023248]|uniref:aspartate/glutamate racemase family protein n=1 Tax=Bacillales TaxID=1385 RepID=UPI002379834B|nr:MULTISPECIES: aspartate/glutamate racemase family protein [Bacillales]MDD9266574.1 aspartate/glutamate racemase family protein [Paenibacillus sp. MAHUQ-63]MDR6878702.1 aspartate/glutamate racemase [Bacillus sp. 3255]
MQTVVAIYTGQGLADPLKKVFQELLPDVRLYNIIDDSLIGDVVRAGHIPEVVSKHLMQYYRHAEEIGADVILNTCSSVGDVADEARTALSVPIVRIDEAMAGAAVAGYERIAVLATLPSTLEPTLRLIQRKADEAGAAVQLVSGLAEGAFDALVGGKPEEHDRLLLETAKRVMDGADVLVLAQGSMARMEQALAEATGKPVLSSPRFGALQVKAVLEAAKAGS